ncbi:hypothetical protein C8R44DRAFT_858747 [Mycena epipterygia]|nr:hypothetical protein C8R44DRAFT_858747 [Mycena epipterygia]
MARTRLRVNRSVGVMGRAVFARASLRLSLTTPFIDVIPGLMRQSNGIQLSPEDTAITAAVPPRRLFETHGGKPVIQRSIAHIGADVHVIAANGSILHAVTPKATKVKAGGDRFGCVRVMAQHQTVLLFNSIEPNSGDAILQPGPQYGPSAAEGGAFWALATWVRPIPLYLSNLHLRFPPLLVSRRRPTFFTTPVHTSGGATPDCVVALTSSSDTSFIYILSFSDVAGTSLSITIAAQLTWATETLEAYGVTSASDYTTGLTSSGASFAYTLSLSNVAGTSLSMTGGAPLTWATETLEAYGVTSASTPPASPPPAPPSPTPCP